MLSVYGIKNCNTVKKGLDWLNKNKIDYEFFDVKKIILIDEKISEWIDNMSEPYSPENLLNKFSFSANNFLYSFSFIEKVCKTFFLTRRESVMFSNFPEE